MPFPELNYVSVQRVLVSLSSFTLLAVNIILLDSIVLLFPCIFTQCCYTPVDVKPVNATI